jgi:glucokinase
MKSAPSASVLVYDVGGSHASAGVAAGSGCRVRNIVTALHPTEQSSGAFIDFLHRLGVEASDGAKDVAGAELAVPGPFDFTAGVSLMQHKLPYLYGVNLREQLAERFGWQTGQVRFVHDAAAFLLGEIGAGAARGVSRAVGITLGTGIGSAFSVDGHLVGTGFGVAPGGEIWNLPFGDGIVEDTFSSRGIQRGYCERGGVPADVAKIAAAAAHDSAAASVFAEFGCQLGGLSESVLADFAPDLVVLGGGISQSAHLFLPAAEAKLKDAKFRLRISAFEDHAPLVGAAMAWFNDPSFAAKDASPDGDSL